MKIFILEDDTFRGKFMVTLLEEVLKEVDFSIVWYTTVQQGEDILIAQKFDVLCLDHDLGNKVFIPSENEGTGYQLAKFIASNNIPYKFVIIHSMNYPGAMKMMGLLKNSIYLPIMLWSVDNLKYLFLKMQ